MKAMRRISIAFIVLICFLGITGKVLAVDCSDSSYAKDHEAYCRDELKNIEAELASLIKQVENQNKKSTNYASEVNKLTTQINALKVKIKARSLVIAQLKNNINKKLNTINSLSEKIKREHESLAQLLRNTNEFDNENIVHLILSDESISDFYSDLESYASIKQAVKSSVEEITGVKIETEEQKKDLEVKQDAELDAKYELESAQKKAAQLEAENSKLLAASKDKEAAYKKLAADRKSKADAIRSALFRLAGIAESQAIDFGTALRYANEAKDKFGIDPAFLLAVLTQETNLGANVGQCYLTDQITGAGVGKNTGKEFKNVMKPMGLSGRKGDIEDFLSITSSLGRIWNKTAVSCPIPSVGGYGGAMGPAQFIPSTWAGYVSRLKNVLGHSPDPWEPRDAFFASAMLLTDKGAVGNSASTQSRAACSYYGTTGSSCAYSRSVMSIKMNKIQPNIDLLSD